MGSCCFTPTKRSYLWWYWLLLASIVGIPMLLAVLYVAKAPGDDDAARRARGINAAWIFWAGSVLVATVTLEFVYHIINALYADQTFEIYIKASDLYSYGCFVLAVQFFFAFVAANAANSLVRNRRWFVRILLVVPCIAVYLVVVLLFNDMSFRRPAIHVMQFLACMLPAHYWGEFKATPDTRSAWMSLRAFVAGAVLFFLVSYFGEDFAQLIYGPPKLGR